MSAPLPIIDFTGFASATPAYRQACADAIGKACREVGFFYLKGHDIAPAMTQAAFQASAAFFAQTPDQKAAIAIEKSACHRGWFRLGEEVLDAKHQPEGDYKEGLKIGRDLAPDHPHVQAGIPLHGPNQWPDIAGWQTTMQAYYDACERVSRQLMQAFALSLNLQDDHFEADLQAPMATLGALYYPPLAPAQTSLSAGAHTDFGCLTLLAQSQIEGLEILNKQGQWQAIPALDDALVVNIGDMLARWTNDLYASTQHRVVNKGEVARYSLAYFFDPDPDADLTALPGCLAPGAVSPYSRATCLSHLLDKIEESFAYRQT
jgi:isopenicillin N synthase-like dioxygenase